MNSCSEIYTAILLIRDNEISSRNKDSPPSTSRKVINLVKFFEREMTSLCFKNANDTRSSAPSPSLSKITKRVGLVRSDYIRGGIIRGSEEWRRWIGP